MAKSIQQKINRIEFDMQVEFCVHLLDAKRNPITVSEAQLNADFAALEPLLPECADLQGLLLFKRSGKSVFKINDALWQSVYRLCFSFVIQALQDEINVFLYRYYTSDEHLVLIPTRGTDGSVRAMLSEMPTTAYPKKEFLQALYDCGMRYLAFIQRLPKRPNDPHRDWVINLLQSESAQARHALEQHIGLI